MILVPVGLGSGICGTALVAAHRRPQTQVIGVQSELAPAVTLSWREGRPIETGTPRTFAEGMATRVPAEMTLDIMRRHVHDMVLVGDDALRETIRLLLRVTHNLAEGAGAAATAAACRCDRDWPGKRWSASSPAAISTCANWRESFSNKPRPCRIIEVRQRSETMFHFKSPGRCIRDDFRAAHWGAFVRYIEVAEDQHAKRQVEVFENGNILRFDREHWCDDFAMMVALAFSRKPKWAKFFPGAELIDAAEFEKVWRMAQRSGLWKQQLESSRVASWGAFRVS